MISLLAAAFLLQTPAPAAPNKLVRLDPRVRPTQLELRLDVDPDRDFLLGNAILDVTLAAPSRSVQLHGRNLEVTRIRMNGAPATWKQLDDEGLAEATAEHELPAGSVRLDIEYRAKLGAVLEGAYVATFEGRNYLTTQMEAISARDVFPCFDEPGFKVPVALTLFVDDGDTAVANTREVARASLPDGRVRVTFDRTPPLPAYLVAFAVGPWDVVEGPVLPPAGTRKDPLPIRAIVPKGQGKRVSQALQFSADAVRAIESYTGVGYAYGKLDIVAVPDFAYGGMENVGLITYRDSRLYLEDNASIDRLKGTFGLVAHEVAHQWFGDLVTMAWWDDVWLNEAFATWMAFRAVEMTHPEYSPRAEFRDYTEYVLSQDSLLSARQIRQPIETKADILDAFDGVTYGKGASVIRMFEGYVGRAAFQRGIRAYLAEHRHGNATARDLIDAVSRNARKDVSAAFLSFLDRPGAPFVEAAIACDGTPRLTVKQSRFLPVGSAGSSAQTWLLPLCVTVDGREICQMLTSAEGAVDLGPGCPKAVLPDAGGRGYYRWSLPAAQLRPLVDGSVKLSAEERIAVSDAVRAGFDSARLSYQDALALALPMANDSSPILAETPLGFLMFARDVVGDEKLRPRVMKTIAATYAGLAKTLGVSPQPGESAETRELRVLALRALVLGAEDQATARALLPLAKKRFGFDDGVMDRAAAPPDLTEVLGAALLLAEPTAADKLMARLDSESDPELRRDLMSAVGTLHDEKTAQRFLDLSLSRSLKVNERLGPAFSMGDDPRTRELTFRWLESNVDALLPVLPEARQGDVPFVMAGACSEADAVRLDKLLRPRVARYPLARPLDQALEGIRLCAAKKAAHQASARAAF